MQRLIRFSKFRNIGLDTDEYLLLNGDFQKGKMGNLIILIGPNNSGKSNVLQGITKAVQDSLIDNRDVTDLSFDDKMRVPSLGLVYRDEKVTIELERKYQHNSTWRVVSGDLEPQKLTTKEIENALEEIEASFRTYNATFEDATKLLKTISSKKLSREEIAEKASKLVGTFYNLSRNTFPYQNAWNLCKRQGNLLVAYYDQDKGNKIPQMQAYLDKKYGIKNIVPRCIVYKEKQISSRDLFVNNPNELVNSMFFTSLLKALSIDVKTIQNTYDQYNQNGNIQYLRKLEKDLQKKVDRINNKFNTLYFANTDQYKFTLVFESNRISFGMAKGKDENPINLEYQSTGFRWFFNLFFNFLNNNGLNPGDIIIMDEPATNLHVQGQHELRDFIKQFGIENDVLFVLATHSPFLLDVDHYDELRVINAENNRCKIDNRFSTVSIDDSDSLLPIKESLTIKQNVLYDLDTEVYFVEGITDYNYLTMFKKLLKIENIAFLPFNGVGTNSAQTKMILQRLLKVKFHRRSLLVDADKAGLDMYKQALESGFDSIHKMDEVKLSETKNAMMVEDLFSPEDKKKFHSIMSKNSDGTSVMKDHCKLSDFSKATIEHFKELFKILQE